MNRPFKTLSSKLAWSCPWYGVKKDEILLPDGRVGQYNIVTKAPAVWVLPVTADGEIVLLRTYRYTVDAWCWELVAGGVKPGQTVEEAALEELHEEIGGRTPKLEFICRSYTANGICDEEGHFFLAHDVTLGPPAHEPAEVMEIHRKPIADVLRMLHNHEIDDAPSAMLLLFCEGRLREMAG
jgi:ADP-ribose pyrophosphatase